MEKGDEKGKENSTQHNSSAFPLACQGKTNTSYTYFNTSSSTVVEIMA